MTTTKALYPERPVLMVDDELPWLRSMTMSLKSVAGITNIRQCQDSREVLNLLIQDSYSLVLLDLTMPHTSGEELLRRIRETYPQTPVIIISGMNQIETAIRCVKEGADDFYVKTDERERIINGIQKVLKQNRLEQEIRQLSDSLLQGKRQQHPAFASIVTKSAKMHSIFSYLQAVANSVEPILISGESGTGKELIAKSLHQLCHPDKPLIAVNVAGLDDMMFSDTLFGHIRGAFTGAEQTRMGMIEKAADGILFLDEIGDLSMASQVKLLRLLQEGEYYPLGSDQPRLSKARVLVATNHKLAQKEAEGSFRRDLLYRLHAHRVELPPLRKRKEDLPLLLEHFLQEAATILDKPVPTYPAELITLLATYHFPGNIRELRAMVHDAVSVHSKGVLSMQRFKEAIGSDLQEQGPSAVTSVGQQVKVRFSDALPTLKEVSRLLIEEAMQRAQGNQSIAARMLGITHQALNQRLKKMGD